MNKNEWFLNGGRGSGRSFRLLCETYENKIAELEKENAELKNNFRICEKNADTYYDNLTRATEIIEGLMRFCRCFAQHHTEDIRYKDAEQFLSEVDK